MRESWKTKPFYAASDRMNFEAAEAYAMRHGLQALRVAQNGSVLERYGDGFDAERPHAIYSGTKSFWGPVALAAQADGLLELDEPVGATIDSWRGGLRDRVTLRHLLSLTAGIPFGGLGNAVPGYEKALAAEVVAEPGTRFTYGGIPLQIFGAVLARKLAPMGMTPQDYLRQRMLGAAGVHIATWRELPDGTAPLPTGASLTARAWQQYGAYVLEHFDALAPCFRGTDANPRYGLGWWLSPLPAIPDLVYASGSGGQALYLIPSEGAIVVKFGNGRSYDHAAFLRRLLS